MIYIYSYYMKWSDKLNFLNVMLKNEKETILRRKVYLGKKNQKIEPIFSLYELLSHLDNCQLRLFTVNTAEGCIYFQFL